MLAGSGEVQPAARRIFVHQATCQQDGCFARPSTDQAAKNLAKQVGCTYNTREVNVVYICIQNTTQFMLQPRLVSAVPFPLQPGPLDGMAVRLRRSRSLAMNSKLGSDIRRVFSVPSTGG